MCKVLKISESGYYRWLKNKDKPSKRQLLLVKIKEILSEHPDNANYGYDRIHKALEICGIKVSKKELPCYERREFNPQGKETTWNNRGKHSIVWRCCTRVEHGPGACAADTIQESELQNLVVRAINMALCKKDAMSENLQKNVEAVLTGADGIPLDEIDSRLEQLQKELLKVANAKGNYDSIADEIYHIREVKQNALVDNAEREGVKQRISEMQQFLAEPDAKYHRI